jgi:hypothetical protein
MHHVFYLAAIFFVQFVCFIHCENATAKQEEQDTFYLRVISTNFTKTVKVSRNFINFLKQDLPTFVSEIKGLDIRRMQNDYQTRSVSSINVIIHNLIVFMIHKRHFIVFNRYIISILFTVVRAILFFLCDPRLFLL